MEHLHGPVGAECVTIALEQIESARSAGPTPLCTRRIYRLTGILQKDTTKWDKRCRWLLYETRVTKFIELTKVIRRQI